MLVRTVSPDEAEVCRRLGEIVRVAYTSLPGHVTEPDYEAELADVARRAALATVAGAFDGDRPLGCVTYAGDPRNPFAEHDDPDAASFRMLGVDPTAQGAGAGTALVQWCIAQARAEGKRRLVIHSTPWMTTAHALYARFGFTRRPDLDWVPVPGIELLGFVLELGPAQAAEASSRP